MMETKTLEEEEDVIADELMIKVEDGELVIKDDDDDWGDDWGQDEEEEQPVIDLTAEVQAKLKEFGLDEGLVSKKAEVMAASRVAKVQDLDIDALDIKASQALKMFFWSDVAFKRIVQF